MFQTDVLVIGSGIAGLTFALKTARALPEKKIAIITKGGESESNTKYAQGGVAVVLHKEDSFEQHVQDTLRAGQGKSDERIVRMVVEEAPFWFGEMVQWGIDFDRNNSGEYDLGMEGGHSANRIVHHKDITGFEVEKKLLQQIRQASNISIFPHYFAIDLITEHHLGEVAQAPDKPATCYGAYVLTPDGKIEKFLSGITMLASGGIGQVYSNTTNPAIATGDGIAMAYRAGAKIQDVAYIQFHPTALYNPDETPSFLISEAVRGAGAYLRTAKGNRFMHKYDKRGELATRDVVAMAIDTELKKSGDNCVFLDCTHLEMEQFINHFPNIYKKCREEGINLENDLIPVVPAVHYVCGGIAVNDWGETAVGNLFACGECSRTGLHGANRLASNSLLEALVFAGRSYQKVVKQLPLLPDTPEVPDWNAEGTKDPEELVLITHNRKELQSLMSNYVGIVRTRQRLERALKRIDLLYMETELLYNQCTISPQLCELRNMITVAYLVVSQSLKAIDNKGN